MAAAVAAEAAAPSASAPLATPEQLPVIDIGALFEPTPSAEAKAAVAAAMRIACTNIGFFFVTGLPLDQAPLFDAARELFSLPDTAKEALDARLSPLRRGYTGLGGAHNCVPAETSTFGPDRKESFLLGAEGSASPMHGPNPWPAEALLPGWQRRVEGYFQAALAVSRAVGRGLALSLGLDEQFFVDKMRDPVAQLLLLRYPPPGAGAGAGAAASPAAGEDAAAGVAAGQPAGAAADAGEATAGGAAYGCGAHTDCGFLTLLAQDGVPGLQVRLASGEWVAAPAIPGALLVNLGDMAAFWTKGAYRSTLHRVFVPRGAPKEGRFSAPFFCNCDFDAPVRPFGGTSGGGGGGGDAGEAQESGEVMRAGDYICEKLGIMFDQKA